MWLSRMRTLRGVEWAVAAMAAGAVALLVTGSQAGGTQYEKRLERLLSAIDGAGEVRVMVNEFRRDGESRTGVVVIAQGAEDVRVAMDLSRAVCSLTGAEPEWVEVFAMGAD